VNQWQFRDESGYRDHPSEAPTRQAILWTSASALCSRITTAAVLVIGSPYTEPNWLDLIQMDSPNTVLRKQIDLPTLSGTSWEPWPKGLLRLAKSTVAGVHIPDVYLNTAWIKDIDGAKSLVMYWTSEKGTTRLAVPITAIGMGSPQYIPQSDDTTTGKVITWQTGTRRQ